MQLKAVSFPGELKGTSADFLFVDGLTKLSPKATGNDIRSRYSRRQFSGAYHTFGSLGMKGFYKI